MHLSLPRIFLSALLASVAHTYRIKVSMGDGRIEHVDVPRGNLTADELLADPRRAVIFSEDSRYDKRQVCTNAVRRWYELVGDGNPHQNYKITQVADTLISCPGTIAKSVSHTSHWDLSLGSSMSSALEAIDITFGELGFSVGEEDTSESTREYSCGAEGDMSEICALHYTAVTAVTVNFYEERSCGSWFAPTKDLGVGVVYLPNKGDIGSVMAQGCNFGSRNIIQCRGDLEREVMLLCGPAGGPEWFDTHEANPFNEQWLAAAEPRDCVVPIEAFSFARES